MLNKYCKKLGNILSIVIMSTFNHIGCSPCHNNSYEGEKLIYPAASRNKEPILQVLKNYLDSSNKQLDNTSPLFLEIASGSGQHLAHFAPHFPGIKFQPSELDTGVLGSISYYARECKTRNMFEPLNIDICRKLSDYGFSANSIDYMYCANLIHISPYECTVGLFNNAGVYLKHNGLLFTYGPYAINGVISPQSNIDFDVSLRSRNDSWGLRDIADLEKLARENHLSLYQLIDMPSNNKTLIWKKD